MKKLFKVFVLIVALLLPALVYLFLKGFGKNEFAIPIYYQEGISIEGCNKTSQSQHYVKFESYDLEGACLFYFPQWVNDEEFYRQCSRIHDKYPGVRFTAIADSSYTQTQTGNILRAKNDDQLYQLANCALILGQDHSISKPLYNQLVLVDKKKRIRGYYNGNELSDMDRLDIEIDILQKEKENHE